MVNQWEQLSLGRTFCDSSPRICLGNRFRMVLWYLDASMVYRRNGFAKSIELLERHRKDAVYFPYNDSVEAIRVARRALILPRILGRLIMESTLCLPGSVSLTSGLLGLGLRAELVLGKARHYLNSRFDLHAWVEVDGIPVIESPQIKYRFQELVRVPKFS